MPRHNRRGTPTQRRTSEPADPKLLTRRQVLAVGAGGIAQVSIVDQFAAAQPYSSNASQLISEFTGGADVIENSSKVQLPVPEKDTVDNGNAVPLRVVVSPLPLERVEELLVLVETNRDAKVAKVSFPLSASIPELTTWIRLEAQPSHTVSAIARVRQGANTAFFGGRRSITVTTPACGG